MAQEPAAVAPEAKVDAVQPEAKKPRGRPKDAHAPVKPKNAMQRVHAEARERIKRDQPEVATDLKALALALKEAWENVAEAQKEQMVKQYEDEMAIWRPLWEAYKETKEYKVFFELKQDYIDGKQKKIMIKKHYRGKIEEGKIVRVGGKFLHQFEEDSPDNYELTAGLRGTIVAVKIDEAGNARVNWDGLGEKVFLKKYHNKVEDPEVPKRPKAGYMIFAGAVREVCQKEVMAEGGGLADVGKKVAEKWGALSETQKAKYDEQSAKMKEAFDIENEAYRKTEKYKDFENRKVNLESKQKLKKLERTQLADAPRPAPSGFALFRKKASPKLMAEDKEAGKPFDRSTFTKRLKEQWDKLSEAEQAPYLENSTNMKKDAVKQKLNFKTTKTYIGFLEQRQKLKIRQNRLVNLRDMPKKPKSVFAMYASEHKKEVPAGKGEGKGMSALKEKFTTVAEEEKKRYEEKQNELLTKWKEDVNSFKEGEHFKTFQTTETKVKREFMNEAMKVMTLKFLNAAPPQPPKSAFAIFVNDKRKASDDADGEPKDKKQKKEELVKFQGDWKKLDKGTQSEYDQTMKDKTAAWKEEVKTFCEDALWKEYLSEAKRLRVPVKSLLMDKKKAIHRLKNGMKWTPMPDKPEDMPSKPPGAQRLFVKAKKAEGEVELDKLGEMWTNLDAEGKKPYQEEAERLLKEFSESMKLFRQSEHGKGYLRTLKSVKRTRIVTKAKFQYLKGMPKQPPSAIKVFLEKNMKLERKAQPDAKGHEIKKQLEERWKAMSEEEKAPLLEEAGKKSSEYEAALKAFKESEDWQKYNKAVKPPKVGGKKPKAKAKAAPNAPKKPEGAPEKPVGAFKEYLQAQTGQGKDLAGIAKDWKEMPAEEKEPLEAKAKEAEVAYQTAMEEFNKTAAGKKYKRELVAFDRKKKIAAARAKYMKKAPKKYLSAFSAFCNEKREEVAKANPNLKGLALLPKLSAAWKELSDEDKKPFQDKEAEAKGKYEEEKSEFEKSADFKKFKAAERSATGKGKGSAKAKAKVDPKAAAPQAPADLPKKPCNAYFMFRNESKAGKEAHQQWLDLKAEGQADWNKKAKEAATDYEKQLKDFKKTEEGKKYFKALTIYDKKKKETAARNRILGKEKDLPKEPKRPQGAYFMFIGENRKGMAVGSESAKQLSEMWSKLEKDEKEKWEAKAKTAKEEYDQAVEEYKKDPRIEKLNKALDSLKGKKSVKKPAKAAKKSAKTKKAPKAKAAKPAKAKAKATSGRSRGAAKAKAAAKKDADSDTDSDAMGSDSSSSSSDSDSD